MTAKKGNLSINSENIFPIIKKWMYSDQDIFIRELVSNACDAITKRRKLASAGECDLPEDYRPRVSVIVDDKNKTLKFIDNGIGMTADEVEEYITQIAFSGATEFLEKYKDKADEDQIIGHFGLGFYSAFMVADYVHIDSLSFGKDAKPVHWECDGSTEYQMDEGDRQEVGTEITLFINDDVLEYANEYKVREVLEKYCSFMPFEIFLTNANAEPQYETIKEEEVLESDKVIETIQEDGKDGEEPVKKAKILKREVPVNDIHPLWTKRPSECEEDEYKAFYRKVFKDYKEPLFWIHLNMDYPFALRGILYFPRINLEYEAIEGTIKLYNNQVFIADNIKEVIPEYLLLLKGVIDCPDLPLNVSRSALQNDGFVKKISDYISKKVADKLSGLCKTKREEYEKYWDDIAPFIKFGCMKDEKFSEKMMDYILYKDLDDKYETLEELVPKKEEPEKTEEEKEETAPEEAEADTEEEKDDRTTVFYVTDPVQQSQYIRLFKEQKKKAVLFLRGIDAAFMSVVENKREDIRFCRIDAEVSEELKSNSAELKKQTEQMGTLFRKVLSKDKLEVKVANLKDKNTAAIVTYSEESRRMQELMKMYSNGMNTPGFEPEPTLVLNHRHSLVKYLEKNREGELPEMICRQLFDMAILANQPLSPEAMTEFLNRTNEIMLRMIPEKE